MPIVTPPASSEEAGPYFTLTTEVINATWDMAQLMSAEIAGKVYNLTGDDGFLTTTGAPQINAGTVAVPVVTAPNVTIPETLEVADVMATYSAEYQELMLRLAQEWSEFISTHFPNESDAYEKVEAWLSAAIDNGGLNPDTESRIYDSQRSAILQDASRAADSVLATFASRRYPVPPGAALAAVSEVQQKAQSEIAKAGGAIAAIKAEMEKFTVEKLMAQRQLALASAGDYIKALVSAPEISSRMAGVGYDAQAKLISAAADFYRADTAAVDMSTKVGQFNVTSALEAATKNQASTLAMIDAKVKVLLTELQMLSAEASALFNNLNASVGVQNSSSGSTNTSTNYNHEM